MFGRIISALPPRNSLPFSVCLDLLRVELWPRLPDLVYASYLEGLEAELVFTSLALPACLLSLPRPLLMGLCVGDLRPLLLSAPERLVPVGLGDIEVVLPVS